MPAPDHGNPLQRERVADQPPLDRLTDGELERMRGTYPEIARMAEYIRGRQGTRRPNRNQDERR